MYIKISMADLHITNMIMYNPSYNVDNILEHDVFKFACLNGRFVCVVEHTYTGSGLNLIMKPESTERGECVEMVNFFAEIYSRYSTNRREYAILHRYNFGNTDIVCTLSDAGSSLGWGTSSDLMYDLGWGFTNS